MTQIFNKNTFDDQWQSNIDESLFFITPPNENQEYIQQEDLVSYQKQKTISFQQNNQKKRRNLQIIENKRMQTRPQTNRCSTIFQINQQSSKSISNSNKVQIQYGNKQLQLIDSLFASQSPNKYYGLNLRNTEDNVQINTKKPVIKICLKRNMEGVRNKNKQFLKLITSGNSQNKSLSSQRQFSNKDKRQNLVSDYFSQKRQTKQIQFEQNLKTRGVLLAKDINNLNNTTKSVKYLKLFKENHKKSKSNSKEIKGIRLFSNQKAKNNCFTSSSCLTKNKYNFSKSNIKQNSKENFNISSQFKFSRKLMNLTLHKTQKSLGIKQIYRQKISLCQTPQLYLKNISPSTFFNQRRIKI